MQCLVCEKGPEVGVTVYRQNEKGQKGVWACERHRVARIEPSVDSIVRIIENRV